MISIALGMLRGLKISDNPTNELSSVVMVIVVGQLHGFSTRGGLGCTQRVSGAWEREEISLIK